MADSALVSSLFWRRALIARQQYPLINQTGGDHHGQEGQRQEVLTQSIKAAPSSFGAAKPDNGGQ